MAICAGVAVLALAMQACATTGTKSGANQQTTARANAQSDTSSLDPVAAAAFWGTRYDREPQNPEVAVKFSGALRKIGSFDESLKVISKTARHNPADATVMLEHGKSLIESNRAFEAVRPIEFALSVKPDDWRILSAYGVALDQIGEHQTAREQYDRALTINPHAISVLNNKGLSFALSGNLEAARATLVRATGGRQASAKVRQNLAFVMALKGDIASAERLARSDLPPQVADNNVEVFRTLLNQPAYWQEFAANGVDVPDFDAPSTQPSTPTVSATPRPSVPTVEPAPLPTLKVAPTPAPQPVEKPEPATAPQSDPKPLSVPDEPVAIDPSEDPGVPLVLGPVVAPSTASFSTGPSTLTPTPSLTGEPSISDLLSDEKESDDAVRLSAPAKVIAPAGVEEMAPEEDDHAGEKTEDDKDA
ncbi:MAG: tetratricopeptide repeat protein [Pseudomonadota bacterium]